MGLRHREAGCPYSNEKGFVLDHSGFSGWIRLFFLKPEPYFFRITDYMGDRGGRSFEVFLVLSFRSVWSQPVTNIWLETYALLGVYRVLEFLSWVSSVCKDIYFELLWNNQCFKFCVFCYGLSILRITEYMGDRGGRSQFTPNGKVHLRFVLRYPSYCFLLRIRYCLLWL